MSKKQFFQYPSWYHSFRGLCLREKKLFFLGILILTISGMVETVTTLSLAPLIDFLNLAGQISDSNSWVLKIFSFFHLEVSLMSLMSLGLSFVLMQAALNATAKFVLEKTHIRILNSFILELYNGFINSELAFFQSNSVGTLSNVLTKESDKVSTTIQVFIELISNALRCFFYFCICLKISPQLMAILTVMMALLAFPYYFLNKYTFRLGESFMTVSNKLSSIIIESLMSAKFIIAHGNQKYFSNKLKSTVEDYCSFAFKLTFARGINPVVFEPIGYIIAFSGLYIGIKVYGMSFSSALIFVYALKKMSSLLQGVLHGKNQFFSFAPTIRNAYNLLESSKNFKFPNGTEKLTTPHHSLTIKELDFSYKEKQILHKINLKIQRGEFVAIVGKSGVGKTTLVDIILGLYPYTQGEILWDTKDYRNLDRESVKSKFAYVSQESFLFNLTFRENLTLGLNHINDQEILRICKNCQLLEVINSLPRGLDTIIEERGSRLSGGQKQRISLARAILRNPEIFILDEATSQLDTITEKLIQQMFVDLKSKGQTLIVIAHRLKTIMNADKIYVLEEGRVSQTGTYQELSIVEGLFKDLI